MKENYADFWTFAMVIEPLYSHWTIVSSKSCTYRKITTESQQQGNETGLEGLTVTRDGDDLRRHLPALP